MVNGTPQHRISRRRRASLLAAAAALTAASMALVPAHGAPNPRGTICKLSGSATISPGLGTTAKTQSISFSTISLTNCLQGSAGAAGVPKFISGSATISPNPVTATASCASGSIKGLTASASWPAGGATISFHTTSVTGATLIQGNVASSSNPNLKSGDLVEGGKRRRA